MEEFTQTDECAVLVTATSALQLSNRDGVLRTWDLTRTGAAKPSYRKITDNALSGCAISDDGRWVYSKADGKSGVVARTDAPEVQPNSLPGTTAQVLRIAFSPHAREVALAMADGSIGRWQLDAKTGKLGRSYRIPGKQGENNLIAYSRSGQLLVAGGESGLVRFWRLDAGKPVQAGQATVPFQLFLSLIHI